ncbi:hypothetical protein VIGAN_UM037900, partial [Vigna angularis var. angularis]
ILLYIIIFSFFLLLLSINYVILKHVWIYVYIAWYVVFELGVSTYMYNMMMKNKATLFLFSAVLLSSVTLCLLVNSRWRLSFAVASIQVSEYS